MGYHLSLEETYKQQQFPNAAMGHGLMMGQIEY
jgi:hypothetical protein